MGNAFVRYRIEDRSYVSFIRREIHSKAVNAKFNEVDTGKIDIIVAELTSNLVKHVGNGEILYRITTIENRPVFEILCIDNGSGIDDTARMMVDGVSTTSTLGQGLGALSRLSGLFQIFSMPKWGTVLYAKVGKAVPAEESKPGTNLEVKAVCVPKPTEEACGDGYRVVQSKSHIKIFFGDGLGHGPHAKEAIDNAANFFFECKETDPVDIVHQMHESVRRTRGLVGIVAVFGRQSAQWSVCGVGNISARIYTGISYQSYMSYNGTIGLNVARSMKPTVLPIERNQHLILCTDGIQTRWDISKYPSVFKFDSNILAGNLYKDFNRGTDDASVLIAKVI
jgi:anti-sigma regulatory factor (Ser/Thr protein kinase)